MLPKAARRGQHFQVRGHSFFFPSSWKKTHASVAVTVVRDRKIWDRAKNQSDCRIRYCAHLDKNSLFHEGTVALK